MTAQLLFFISLNLVLLFCAVGVGVRSSPGGRAELGVIVGLLWDAFVALPILLLGWFNVLFPWTVALSTTSCAVASWCLSSYGIDLVTHLRRTASWCTRLIALPVDAIVYCWQAASFAVVGIFASIVLVIYSGWLTYLAPSVGWDGIWYHETIVGYAIQNHGFKLVDLPGFHGYINGFPRICEMTNLWCVLFCDRRLIELPNTLMSPVLLLAMYVIMRRFCDRSCAIGWASCVFLMPGVLVQLRSTYIDAHILALYLCALHMATRPVLRLRDGLLAGLGLAMLVGTKGHALAWVPLIGAVALPRVVYHHVRRRAAAAMGVVAAGIGLVLAVAVPTYLRNWRVYANPIWPVHIENAKHNIHWAGFHENTEMNKPVKSLLSDMMSLPVPGHDWPDTATWGYGMGGPFLVLPIATLALVWAVSAVLRSRLYSRWDAKAWNVLLVALPGLGWIPISPALWSSRYNYPVAAVMFVLTAWWCARAFGPRFSEGVMGTCLATSLMMFWWADPAWSVTLQRALQLARETPLERSADHTAEYMMEPKVALARAREIGRGDVVSFGDNVLFPSQLWNETYSNNVVYVPWQKTSQDYLERLRDARAKWTVVNQGSAEYQALLTKPEVWEEIGAASTTGPPRLAFRDKSMSQTATP